MTPKHTYEQLIEKIARAKMQLQSARRSHTDSCPVEWDPEGYAPCRCGASAHNAQIQRAIAELEL